MIGTSFCDITHATAVDLIGLLCAVILSMRNEHFNIVVLVCENRGLTSLSSIHYCDISKTPQSLFYINELLYNTNQGPADLLLSSDLCFGASIIGPPIVHRNCIRANWTNVRKYIETRVLLYIAGIVAARNHFLLQQIAAVAMLGESIKAE